MATATVMTRREQETYDAIKAKGKTGATFEEVLGAASRTAGRDVKPPTIRPRLSKLAELGKIRSERQKEDARKVRYFVIGKA